LESKKCFIYSFAAAFGPPLAQWTTSQEPSTSFQEQGRYNIVIWLAARKAKQRKQRNQGKINFVQINAK